MGTTTKKRTKLVKARKAEATARFQSKVNNKGTNPMKKVLKTIKTKVVSAVQKLALKVKVKKAVSALVAKLKDTVAKLDIKFQKFAKGNTTAVLLASALLTTLTLINLILLVLINIAVFTIVSVSLAAAIVYSMVVVINAIAQA